MIINDYIIEVNMHSMVRQWSVQCVYHETSGFCRDLLWKYHHCIIPRSCSVGHHPPLDTLLEQHKKHLSFSRSRRVTNLFSGIL